MKILIVTKGQARLASVASVRKGRAEIAKLAAASSM
jgi:hypothetical protein